ncbi:MAG: acyltransferase [Deltaproteobacteria bacterium]|nr:acyltransferase [Deltaproteobacteria bacterium]
MTIAAAPAGQRHSAIDWVKALAIVSVVMTHSGSGAFPRTPGYTVWDALFAHTLASFHVPCLFMVSGYLYRKPYALGWRAVAARLERIVPAYLVASVVVLILMPWRAPTWSAAVVALLGGDALSIYYYVFLLALFVATLPLLSRLSLRTMQATVWGLLAALVAICALPPLVLSHDIFWSLRNPVESFALGYFLLGWIAAAPAGALTRWSARLRLGLTVVAAAAWPVCVALGSPYPTILLAKVPYAAAVWTLAWFLFESKPVPAAVRRLSDASYGVFLYHYLIQEPLRGPLQSWPAGARMAVLVVAGVAGSLLLGAMLRKIAGPRVARRLFGF